VAESTSGPHKTLLHNPQRFSYRQVEDVEQTGELDTWVQQEKQSLKESKIK